MSSYPPVPQRKNCNCEDPCISTDDVYYAGPNLPNSGANTYDILTEVIEKLDNIYSTTITVIPTLQQVTNSGNYTTTSIIANSFQKIGGNGNNILLDNGTVLPIANLPSTVTETSQLINDGEDGINPFITAQDIPAFNPSNYDLDEFTNNGIDPFAHISDIPVGGTQTLAQTLVLGNNTGGRNILLNDADSLLLENGSYLIKGRYGLGGLGGISRICSIGYEDNWQNGFRHVFDANGFVRNSTNCFDDPPTVNSDVTQRYKVGSIWTLDDLTNYICTDATEGAAVWEFYKEIPPPLAYTPVNKAGDTMSGLLVLSADPGAALGAATKQYVDSKVISVYRIKGSVANYAALPSSGQVIGDVWNLLDTGANYVWTGTVWDALGTTVDISGKANIDSPTFTGIPLAPTAATGTDNTQIATTAFVAATVNNRLVIETTAGYSLTNADSGGIIIFKTTVNQTLNIPLGLSAGFECTFVTLANVILSVAANGNILNNAAGTTMTGGLSFTLKRMLSSNTFIATGNL